MPMTTSCRYLSQINSRFTSIMTDRWHSKNMSSRSCFCQWRISRCSGCFRSFRNWSRTSSRSRITCRFTISIVFNQRGPNFYSCSCFDEKFSDFSRVRRKNLLHEFIVLNFCNRIIFFNFISNFNEPVGNIAFMHSFTNIRHGEDLSIARRSIRTYCFLSGRSRSSCRSS